MANLTIPTIDLTPFLKEGDDNECWCEISL